MLGSSNQPAPGSNHTSGIIFKAASASFAGQIYQLILSLVSGLVIARLIGPAAYGTFNLARTLCDAASLVTKGGFDIGIVRFLGERPGDLRAPDTLTTCRRVLLVIAIIGLIPAVLILGGGGTLLERYVFNHNDFGRVLGAMALAIPFMSLLQVAGGMFRGHLRLMPRILTELVLQPSLRLILFLACFALGWRLWAVVWGTLLSYILSASLIVLWASRTILASDSLPVQRHDTQSSTVAGIARYSTGIAFSVLMAMLLTRLDTFVLGHFANATILGQYAIAQMVAGLLGTFNIALAQAAAPVIADLGRRDARGEMAVVLHQHARWVAIMTAPAFFALVVYGNDVVAMLGPEYAMHGPTVAILAAGQMLLALLSSAGYTLSMTGRQLSELRLLSIAAAATFLAQTVLIPRFGVSGAAWGTLGGIALANVMRSLLVRRLYNVWPLDIDALRPMLIAGLLFAASRWGLDTLTTNPSPVYTLTAIAIALLAYGLLTMTIGLGTPDRMALARWRTRLSHLR